MAFDSSFYGAPITGAGIGTARGLRGETVKGVARCAALAFWGVLFYFVERGVKGGVGGLLEEITGASFFKESPAPVALTRTCPDNSNAKNVEEYIKKRALGRLDIPEVLDKPRN